MTPEESLYITHSHTCMNNHIIIYQTKLNVWEVLLDKLMTPTDSTSAGKLWDKWHSIGHNKTIAL